MSEDINKEQMKKAVIQTIYDSLKGDEAVYDEGVSSERARIVGIIDRRKENWGFVSISLEAILEEMNDLLKEISGEVKL